VLFVVEAHDGIERIGAGTHARAVVNYDRFVRNLPAKRPTLG
jgi:predicted thioesterase